MQLLRAEQRGQQRHQPSAGQQAERDGQRLPGAEQPTLALRGELGHQRHGAAEFAAGEQPLKHAQQRQQQRGGDADRGIGRHNADQRGG